MLATQALFQSDEICQIDSGKKVLLLAEVTPIELYLRRTACTGQSEVFRVPEFYSSLHCLYCKANLNSGFAFILLVIALLKKRGQTAKK